MASNAILYRMAAGIPGTITRTRDSTVEQEIVGTANQPSAFGLACVYDSTVGGMRVAATGDAATSIKRVNVRAFPGGQTTDPLGTSTPPAAGVASYLVRGYISVLLGGATAAVKDGSVYVWIAASTGAHIQGGFEAAASGANTVQLPVGTCWFTGPADANGNTEIAFNI